MVRAKVPLNDLRHDGLSIDELPRPLWLFFFGEGVEGLAADNSPWRSLAEEERVDLAYCTTAWERRDYGSVPAWVEGSSLVQFWAIQLDLWRREGRFEDGDAPLSIRFNAPRDALGWKESLEIILAAATLDLTMLIEFNGPAWKSLLDAPDQRRAWQQLLDFELATLTVHGLPADAVEVRRGVAFAASRRSGDAASNGGLALEF